MSKNGLPWPRCRCLKRPSDHDGLCEIWFTLANGVYNVRCRYDQMRARLGRGAPARGARGPTSHPPLPACRWRSCSDRDPSTRRLARLAELTCRICRRSAAIGAILLAMRDRLRRGARAPRCRSRPRSTNSAWRWVTPGCRGLSSGSRETTRKPPSDAGRLLRVPGRARADIGCSPTYAPHTRPPPLRARALRRSRALGRAGTRARTRG